MRKICRAALICGAIICTAAAAAVIAACGGKEEHSYAEPIWMWNGTENAAAVFTCTDEGCNASVICTAVIGHSVTPAACETDGADTYTATVTLDGNTYTDVKSFTAAALGHVYGEPEWGISDDGRGYAEFTCTREGCGGKEKISAYSNADLNVTPASCKADGNKSVRSAVFFNGRNYTHTFEDITVPATGHRYGEPEAAWKYTREDGQVQGVSVEATFRCANDDCYHRESVSAAADFTVTEQPGCTEEGLCSASAEVGFNGRTYSLEGTIYIAPLQHLFRAEYFMYGDDPYSCWPSVNLYCTREGCDSRANATAEILSDTLTEPDCTTPGTRRIVAGCHIAIGRVFPEEYEFTLYIPPRHAELETVYAAEPTCTERGNKNYKICRACGIVLDYSTEQPIAEEDYILPSWHESGETFVAERNDADTHKLVCRVCGVIKSEAHDFSGTGGHTCIVCGYSAPAASARQPVPRLPGKKEEP